MGSPLSAVHRDLTWRLIGLQTLVVLFTICIGLGFFFSTKFFIESGSLEHAKSTADTMSYSLSKDAMAMTELHSGTQEALQKHLLQLLDRTPRATSISILEKQKEKSSWKVLASTKETSRGMVIALPIIAEVEDQLEPVVFGSGSTLQAFVPLYDANAKAQEILILETYERFWWEMMKAFLAPFLLLLFAGIFIARSVKAYAYQGKTEVKRQIDSNRLALLELATHQLGAPLATFRWWHELLGDPDGKDLLVNADVMEQISQAIDRMGKIVKAMTEATHVESGGVGLNIEVLKSLKHILQRVLDDARPELTRRKQRLEIFLDPNLAPVQIDTKLIFGILQELIENAISYSPDSTTISIRAKKEGDHAEISVTDQGYGIPEEDLIHIGEKFTRASNAAQHKPVGNGLGLFIAKGIIQNCGGDLWVESKLGRGTTVHFTLPFDPYAKG